MIAKVVIQVRAPHVALEVWRLIMMVELKSQYSKENSLNRKDLLYLSA